MNSRICQRGIRAERRVFRSFWPRSALALCVFLPWLSTAAGCGALRRRPKADQVIAARQLSMNGLEAMERGRWGEAESLLRQAIELCPVDERAHCRYAEVLWRRGASDEAMEHMRRAALLSGGDAELLVQLGEMHLARGEREEAGRRAEQAIRANRQLAAARAFRGDVLFGEGRLDEALACYHRALTLQSDQRRVELAIAEIYRRQGRPLRALGALEALADRDWPDGTPQEVLGLEGLALKELGRYDDAAACLSAARDGGEPNADLLYHLGEAQFLAGKPGSARLTVLAALALDPGHAASQQLRLRIEGARRRLAAASRPGFPEKEGF